MNNRPICQEKNCKNKTAIHNYSKSGKPYYRKVCERHHKLKIAMRHNVDRAEHVTAIRKNMSIAEYKNKRHPYRKHRKSYCENIDGRLGFKCTTTIVWHGMLDVDHINGLRNDNSLENLQTLCKCCHSYKTVLFKDSKKL